jgi:DNA polymerase-3 subunit gamma/tau
MSYTVLARKYRPQKFSDVIGQDHVTRTLRNALEQQRIAHGYIFSGHRGIGKTTIARILAMALNCKSSDRPVTEPCGVCDSCREIREGSVGAMDVIEIDAATNRGIEEVRGLIATATAEPARDRYRIFILDEAHQVTDAAFNALLKTLEEPPSWVVFMMATTQPEDIPQTIRSRCQHFSFHAVRFEEIVGQLRSISAAEQLTVDDDALALVAEAGDGSMRDALSIMDQAISCCGTTLTAEQVRGLIGSVSSEVMEQVMNAVHANSSEQVLRIADKLMVEGHSPTYFTRQFVRFLRNTIVAKVAGENSSLLQISSDEKARVLRVAALFSEEDLTRFLQVMLRTHGDVSYKQEQRFHLELGLLKLVHAQRLLPIEQLLSGARLQEAPAAPPTRAAQAPPTMPPSMRTPPPTASRPAPSSPFGGSARPSPLQRDSARKNTPEMSAPSTPEASAPQAAPTLASPAPFSRPPAAPVVPPAPFARPQAVRPEATPTVIGSAAAVAMAIEKPVERPAPVEAESNVSVDKIRDAVLSALDEAGQRMLTSMLEEGDWEVQGNQLVITIGAPMALVDLSFGPEHKKTATATATKVAGRPIRLNLVSGTPTHQSKPSARRSTGDARGRAADEPVVKRMIEKFGAEIRTVIDSE